MSSISKLGCIVISFAILYAFAYPYFGNISSLRDERSKYDNSLSLITQVEAKKSELLGKFDNISADDRKNIEIILPSSANFVKLISQIDTVGSKHGIFISKTTYREIDPPAGASIGEVQPDKPYQSAVIGFSFSAPYAQFGNFISELERSLRILDIRSLKIKPTESGSYDYEVEFETYWVK